MQKGICIIDAKIVHNKIVRSDFPFVLFLKLIGKTPERRILLMDQMNQGIRCDVNACEHNCDGMSCCLGTVKITCDCTGCTCCGDFKNKRTEEHY